MLSLYKVLIVCHKYSHFFSLSNKKRKDLRFEVGDLRFEVGDLRLEKEDRFERFWLFSHLIIPLPLVAKAGGGSVIQAKTLSFAWYYAPLALPLASPKVLSL